MHSQPPGIGWTTGYWFWDGSSAQAALPIEKLDALFVQVGTIHQEAGRNSGGAWSAYGHLPDMLPAAQEYWLVYRFDRQAVPDLQVVSILARELDGLRNSARKRHLNVAGVQFDIDSPTRTLPQYAEFLRGMRKAMPPEFQISITALLDWFRDGTSIAEVVKETDEFVPQFYDVGQPDGYDRNGAIAAKFDAAQWAPRFNRYRKRFRIGISTFGRARLLRKDNPSLSNRAVLWFSDPTPMDFAATPAFNLISQRSDANELLLNYRATRTVTFGYNRFQAGDTMQFILSTPDAIRTAVEGAKHMGGYGSGVVFFRWPSPNETLTMQPNEVLMAAGLIPREHTRHPEIHVTTGGCVAVSCVDVFLLNPDPFSPSLARYRIHSSVELQYFLPEDKIPVRMAAPSILELSLPAYCGRGNMYLGRAVSDTRAEFTVEQEP